MEQNLNPTICPMPGGGDIETLKRIVEADVLTYERALLLEIIHNPGAFKALKGKLCPWQEKLQSHRSDFATRRYNTLYAAIFNYWSIVGGQPNPGPVHRGMLEAIIIDWTNKGKISADEGQALVEELGTDFYNPAMRPPQAYAQALVGPMFAYWLDVRLTRRITEAIANEARNQIITAEVVKARVTELEKMCVATHSSAVSAALLMDSEMPVCGKVGTSLNSVDQALGGGYGFGQATLIAGCNAAGKTVLAAQLAVDFSNNNLKVVYVTTEQPPRELIARMASNVMQVNYSHFTNRKEDAADKRQDRMVSVIPRWIREDPQYAEKLKTLRERLQNIYFLDWSQGKGQSIASNLEGELDQLEAKNFVPDILIVDWIGGGLDKSQQGKVELRHIYQHAAEWGIDYAKRKNKVVIEMAQFDRVKAMGKPKCGSAMLSECKTMANNMTNFIGISAIVEQGSCENEVFTRTQYFYVEKSRDGRGGSVAVERHFHYQRFLDKAAVREPVFHAVPGSQSTGVGYV